MTNDIEKKEKKDLELKKPKEKDTNINLNEMTPKEIVNELDKYIIGQDSAKKSVAIALRNRYRRNLLDEKMKEEITPKNILMMGPTGVGKTEIARRLAKLMGAPFVKVEATKFTEVGYVGRDVESMVKDLVEAAIRIQKHINLKKNEKIARERALDRIAKIIIPSKNKKSSEDIQDQNNQNNQNNQQNQNPIEFMMNTIKNANLNPQNQQMNQPEEVEEEEKDDAINLAREQVRRDIKEGKLDKQVIDVAILEDKRPRSLDLDDMGNGIPIGNIFDLTGGRGCRNRRRVKRKMKVKDALETLTTEEASNLLDMDDVITDALHNAEQNGIIFIDEIDKVASGDSFRSANVSREGVQRDILPIIEGSVVKTKYGPVKTDHILFIGAGAFHISKPTDLIPELQGRFPIRVTLENLDEETFYKILTIPKNALIKQHKALLETEGVTINFDDESIKEIAKIAYLTNEQTENIGARRLHTIMEKLLEDISFNISDSTEKEIKIDKSYVDSKFIERIKADDVDKYIL